MASAKPENCNAPTNKSRRGLRNQEPVLVDNAQRKRHLDRIAQRNHRERIKNRITFLEERVRTLERLDRDGDLSSLMAAQEKLSSEKSELRTAMSKIRLIADMVMKISSSTNASCPNCANKSDGPGSPDDTGEEFMAQRRTSTGSQASLDKVPEWQQSYTQKPLILGLDYGEQDDMDPVFQPAESNLLNEAALDVEDIVPIFQPPVDGNLLDEAALDIGVIPSYNIFMGANSEPLHNVTDRISASSSYQPLLDWTMSSPTAGSPIRDISKIVNHGEKWFFCNREYGNGLEMVRTGNSVHRKTIDPAIPIQAILWGWNTIDAKIMNHPAWAAIRAVDERVFGLWKSKAQKIALVLMASLIMQYHLNPTKENLAKMPAWLRPRPSQQRIQHPLVIDFLIWPGLREYLVFNHQAYTLTGDFSQHYTEDFNFNWPFPDTMIFDVTPTYGQYKFSRLFETYVFDLENWTMNPRFFQRFKEFESEIPVNPRTGLSPGGVSRVNCTGLPAVGVY